jgi:hypothetical protein
MRKLRYAFWAVSIFCLCTSAWAGSSIHVSGEVWGIWPSGDSVFVDGASVVPANKLLMIESGAIILFKTTDRFVIEGRLEALGTEEHPIILVPAEGWNGFYFAPNDHDLQVLEYVVIPESAPLPRRVVQSEGASLQINRCSLRALRSCLDINHGRLWASRNLLVIHGQYSSSVSIRNLENDQTRCSAQSNRLTGNIIKADVPEAADPWIPSPTEFTCGLYLDGSTNLCMWDNTVSVIASGSTIGVYFGQVGPGDGMAQLDSCVVTARSYDGAPKGVFNANEGSVRIRRCVVDVAEVNPDNLSLSAGILASHQAEVTVNSSIVAVDRDTMWFVPVSGGRLTVDYLTRWSTESSIVIGGDDPDSQERSVGLDGGGDPTMGVTYGVHVYTADPILLRAGVWGAWTSPEEVAEYYGIAAGSPCVDTGDLLFGYDPDNTLPDIGRFYFPQGPNSGGDPGWQLPNVIRLSPAYPNPFNASTTIPFVVNRNGQVTMTVWDLTGRRVATLLSAPIQAGNHEVRFDSENLGSGVYLVRILLNGEPAGGERLILLK